MPVGFGSSSSRYVAIVRLIGIAALLLAAAPATMAAQDPIVAARRAVARGDTRRATEIARTALQRNQPTTGFGRLEQAELLATLGNARLANATTHDDSVDAESYLAAALSASPELGTLWLPLLRLRLARDGYGSLRRHALDRQPLRYAIRDRSLSVSQREFSIPSTADEWDLILSLALDLTSQRDSASALLLRHSRRHVSCYEATLLAGWQGVAPPADALERLAAEQGGDCRFLKLTAAYQALRGSVFQQLGDSASARAAFEEAVRLDETDAASALELALLDPVARRVKPVDLATVARAIQRAPDRWSTWQRLWIVGGYETDTVRAGEFARLARETRAVAPSAVAPVMAEALAAVRCGHLAVADSLLRLAALSRPPDIELRINQFALALARTDQAAVERLLPGLRSHFQQRSAGGDAVAPNDVGAVALAHRGDLQGLAMTADLLHSAWLESRDYLAGVALDAYLSKLRDSIPGGRGIVEDREAAWRRATEAALATQIAHAAHVDEVLQHVTIRLDSLTVNGRQYAEEIVGLRLDQQSMQTRVTLTEKQIGTIRTDVNALRTEYLNNDASVNARIEQLQGRFDALDAQQRATAKALDVIAQIAQQNSTELALQGFEVRALKEWRKESAPSVMGALNALLGAVSLTTKFVGPFQIDLLGLVRYGLAWLLLA